MYLIVGATGSLGGQVAKQLLARGERVRAVVRPESPLRRAGRFTPAQAGHQAALVRFLGDRTVNSHGQFEYETIWEDGDVTIQLASSFMDADGTFSIKFLQQAEKEDIEDALADHKKASLKTICLAQSLKVPLTFPCAI